MLFVVIVVYDGVWGCLIKCVYRYKNCIKKDVRKDSSNFIKLILEMLFFNLF